MYLGFRAGSSTATWQAQQACSDGPCFCVQRQGWPLRSPGKQYKKIGSTAATVKNLVIELEQKAQSPNHLVNIM